MTMIDVTAAIVANRGADVFGHGIEIHDQFQRAFVRPFRLRCDGIVQIGDIRLMMFAVVDFHRPRIHVRFQRVVIVS